MNNLQNYITLRADYLNSGGKEEVLLFSPQNNRGFAVTGAARYVLKYLDGKSTLEEVYSRFSQDYELPQGQFRQEIIEFIDELEREELVIVSSSPSEDDKTAE